jgi:malate dehydrogenase (oxaloacetate-decarboxylating)
MLHRLGVKEIVAFNKDGILHREQFDSYDFLTQELLDIVNLNNDHHTLAQALVQADVFIGVSAPRLVTSAMVSTMKKDAIVFAMANPEPEITYDEAIAGGAKVVGTGRSDYPNQVNNVLAFPGLFRGALDCQASKITEEMKMAAAVGLASLISEDQLRPDYVIPSAFDPRVASTVAAEVKKTAIATDIARIK